MLILYKCVRITNEELDFSIIWQFECGIESPIIYWRGCCCIMIIYQLALYIFSILAGLLSLMRQAVSMMYYNITESGIFRSNLCI